MPLVDWSGRWRPVETEQPCRVRIPAQTQTDEQTQPPQRTASARRRPAPRELVLVVPPDAAGDLALHVPALVAGLGAARDDRVTVDLRSAADVHLTGLHLLLAVLWRRVGPYGDVAVVGGSRGLRSRLASLGVTAQDVRRDVLGSSSPVRPQPQPQPAGPEAAAPRRVPVPEQRRGQPVRLELSGELDAACAARTRERLDEALATGAREVELDLAGVTFMDLTTLRVLLQADAQLRARGGRLRLLDPCPIVRRLLAVTATQRLAAVPAGPAAEPGAPSLPVRALQPA